MKCCSLSPRFVHLHFLYLLPSVVKTICSSSIFLQLWSDGTSNIYCIHSIYRQACNFQLNLLHNSYPLLLYSVLSFLSDIIFIILTDSMFFLFFFGHNTGNLFFKYFVLYYYDLTLVYLLGAHGNAKEEYLHIDTSFTTL